MATDVLELISKDEKERLRYESELIFDLDQRSRVNDARKEGKVEVAKSMLSDGLEYETIMKYTELSLEEIQSLA